MNMCVHGQTKKAASKDIAYIVVRTNYNYESDNLSKTTPIAIFENQGEAEDMAGAYNQEMIDKNIKTLMFEVMATAFYPE